jgi:prepilin-type processing-associated H-X9-DG protein
MCGGAQSFNRGIFLDVDTVPGDAPLHYSCHPRLMPNITGGPLLYDGTTTHGVIPYKIGSIQRSADIVLVMDGVQIADSPNASNGANDPNYWGASATAYAVDGWRLEGGWIYIPDWLLSGRAVGDDGSPINPGFNKDAASISYVQPGVTTNGDIRWRHLNNSAANFLFVDGHVESHSIAPNPGGGTIQPYKTDLMGRNFNVNP